MCISHSDYFNRLLQLYLKDWVSVLFCLGSRFKSRDSDGLRFFTSSLLSNMRLALVGQIVFSKHAARERGDFSMTFLDRMHGEGPERAGSRLCA